MPVLSKIDDKYVLSNAGSIEQIANLLFDEYGMIGYSLTPEDLETILINDFLFYSGWAATNGQTLAVQPIDRTAVISVAEWGILENVIRAHSDWLHAQRMEASEALGGTRFGIDAITANQNYMNAKENMKKEAFVEKPFTIDYDYRKPFKRI